MSKKIVYGDQTLPLVGDMTLEEAKDWAAQAIPGIADAEGYEDDEGNYVFQKRAGRKG
jgi:hypothetical protein